MRSKRRHPESARSNAHCTHDLAPYERSIQLPHSPHLAEAIGRRAGRRPAFAALLAIFGLAAGLIATPVANALAATATRVVSTPQGKVRVPVDPKRIVVINPQPMATLYDLGIKVIGVYDEGAQYVSPRYLARYNAAAKVGAGQVDLEKVAALHPDLIIGANYSFNSDDFAQLSKIAPTVLAPTNGTWQDIAAATANFVNRSSSLASFKQKLTARDALIKSTYADVLAKYRWDILQGGFDDGHYWLYGPGSDTGKIFAAAGVRFAAGTRNTPRAGERTLSYENIGALSDAGVIGYYSDYQNKPNNDAPQLFAQAGFKALTAVKAKHTVALPDFLPGGYGDALALLNELTAGLKQLAK